MFKKLISPLAHLVLWSLHRAMFAATYGIVYLKIYLGVNLIERDTVEIDKLYISDLTHFADREEVDMGGQTALIVLSYTEQALKTSHKDRIDLAMCICQVTTAIPQVRKGVDGAEFVFVDGTDVDNNIAISMWMAYFYAYHTGYLNRV